MAPASSEPSQSDSPAPVAGPPAGRWLARAMIVLTGLFVIAMIWLLFSRWLALSEPAFVLFVLADDPWADAIVTIDGASLDKPLVTGVVPDHTVRKYPFYLDRGSYRLTVERGGVIAVQQDFLVAGGQSAEFDLRKHADALQRLPASQPTTQPTTDQSTETP